MTRKELIFHHIDPQGLGIEIGPGYNPAAPKREGYRVQIIDHVSREQLIESNKEYLDHYVSGDDRSVTEDFEEVDFIWNGQPYVELTGKSKYYDWIIASHVIEHTADLIGFLKDCDSILKDDGVLSLAIPDKRFCFDCFRPPTGITQVIDAHLDGRRRQSAGTVADHYLNLAVDTDGQTLWDANEKKEYRPADDLDKARSSMAQVIDDGKHIDVHNLFFTPHSFRMIIEDLYLLGLSSLREMCFFPTGTFEFFVTLGRAGKGPGIDRHELHSQIEAELNHAHVARLSEFETELQDVRAQRDGALSEIGRIHASNSWKVTAPLRWIGPAAAGCVDRVKRTIRPAS